MRGALADENAGPPSEPEYAGLVAAVTGGASGIGLATALELQARGARVAVLDRTPAALPDGLLGLTCDVRDAASLDQAIEQVIYRWGGLDVLINNAGIEARGTILDNDDDEWTQVLDVNVIGMARTIRAALPHLRRSRAGAIVNTCSVAALCGMRSLVLYSASKGAVLAMTRSMAADLVDEGIRVNCVSPGTVDTPWIGRLLGATSDPAVALSTLRARQPTGRLISAAEVAAAIAFLASPLSPSVTGTSLVVDGGMVGLQGGQPVMPVFVLDDRQLPAGPA